MITKCSGSYNAKAAGPRSLFEQLEAHFLSNAAILEPAQTLIVWAANNDAESRARTLCFFVYRWSSNRLF